MSTLTRANAVHLRIQGRQCGPLTQDQVKSLVRQGTASPGDAISMDGGQTWVLLGQTSLIKYVPLQRVHGRLHPAPMPDHIDLSFTAEVMALPAPPKEMVLPEVEVPQVAPPVHRRRSLVPAFALAAGCLAGGFLIGFWAGHSSVPPVSDAPRAPLVPILRLAQVDGNRSGQVVALVGTLGEAEGRAEPAQLPGLSGRHVLVRIHVQDASFLAAIPWRGSADPVPNTLYAPMSDAGTLYNPKTARLSDATGAEVAQGARVHLTGKVRFKISDVPMEHPILEVAQVRPAQERE